MTLHNAALELMVFSIGMAVLLTLMQFCNGCGGDVRTVDDTDGSATTSPIAPLPTPTALPAIPVADAGADAPFDAFVCVEGTVSCHGLGPGNSLECVGGRWMVLSAVEWALDCADGGADAATD